MKPDTEKRLAERLGFRIYLGTDTWWLLWNGSEATRAATSGEIALWQLCGELMEELDAERDRAHVFLDRLLPHPLEGE